MSRLVKKAVTGEGTSLMKIAGTGEVFLADQAQDIHLIKLENDQITCNGANLLAFDAGIDWDIKREKGVEGQQVRAVARDLVVLQLDQVDVLSLVGEEHLTGARDLHQARAPSPVIAFFISRLTPPEPACSNLTSPW